MESIWEAALLGLLQGLTEFLPVSSSGHLALGQILLGWDYPSANLAFNVAVHVGSLLAVLVFVRREIIDMLTRHPRVILTLVVATLPVALVGPPVRATEGWWTRGWARARNGLAAGGSRQER